MEFERFYEIMSRGHVFEEASPIFEKNLADLYERIEGENLDEESVKKYREAYSSGIAVEMELENRKIKISPSEKKRLART